ncbi:hypothetical protein CEXT_304601 [Caerostris extrusa]|uniref:Uncharacterized protein n=1 Tax=Caerostris extrusa TaxID=172846 RepID=A0AAV4YB45_CAEEX|nr:hypothetical protein CEXT_304601 [Caerostris extrusa]
MTCTRSAPMESEGDFQKGIEVYSTLVGQNVYEILASPKSAGVEALLRQYSPAISYLLFPCVAPPNPDTQNALMTCVGLREICRRALKCEGECFDGQWVSWREIKHSRNLWVFLSVSGQAHDAIRDRGCTERFEFARLCGKGGVFISL